MGEGRGVVVLRSCADGGGVCETERSLRCDRSFVLTRGGHDDFRGGDELAGVALGVVGAVD